MNRAQFIEVLKRKHISPNMISKIAKRTDLYDCLEGLRMSTAAIDFGCQFDDQGKCNGSEVPWIDYDPACCCKDCAFKVGYLDIVFEDDITKYAKKFSLKTGFWRKASGCILPRKMRSRTCLLYSCYAKVDNKLYGIRRSFVFFEEKMVEYYDIRY